jgi:hypothetical protein
MTPALLLEQSIKPLINLDNIPQWCKSDTVAYLDDTKSFIIEPNKTYTSIANDVVINFYEKLCLEASIQWNKTRIAKGNLINYWDSNSMELLAKELARWQWIFMHPQTVASFQTLSDSYQWTERGFTHTRNLDKTIFRNLYPKGEGIHTLYPNASYPSGTYAKRLEFDTQIWESDLIPTGVVYGLPYKTFCMEKSLEDMLVTDTWKGFLVEAPIKWGNFLSEVYIIK